MLIARAGAHQEMLAEVKMVVSVGMKGCMYKGPVVGEDTSVVYVSRYWLWRVLKLTTVQVIL